jgi:FKBP-type peptidyl-prolyl cis-trans isomerase
MTLRRIICTCAGVLILSFAFGQGKPATTKSGLRHTDLEVGSGQEVKNGDTVRVHYTGWLYENGKRGRKFDSSKDRNQPFIFTIGEHKVIRGWEEGVVGMKRGGKRELIIPPGLAYGDRGHPAGIPPKATLNFEIELLGIRQR